VWAGLGWHTPLGDVADFVLTVVWIAGIINAFNLMDNLDGACATVGGVCAIGIGTMAAIHGQAAIAGLSFALAGGCAGFLPFNLARPSRIFLGDGGSMLIGFLVGALSLGLGRNMRLGDADVLAVAIFAGLPILDTALVSVSRIRRGVTLVTGGRDHLTHRLLLVLNSPRAVALALASAQAALCTLAIISVQLGRAELIGLAIGTVSAGVVAIAVLDTTRWRPAGIAFAPQLEPVGAGAPRSKPVGAASVGVDPG
jgi:UDP-GlcNAc:undecaprenyl-phosphate GlcNAc-1-phosphate transferase